MININKKYHLILIQIRLFLYYFLIANLLRYLLNYKTKYESTILANHQGLLIYLIYDKITNIYRQSIGLSIETMNIQEIYKKKDQFVSKNNKNLLKIHIVLEECLYRSLFISSFIFIILIIITILIYFFNYFEYLNIKFIFSLLLSLLGRLIVINNGGLRGIVDLFSIYPISAIASFVQALLPIIIYKILDNFFGINLNMNIIIFITILGSILAFLINYIHMYNYLGKLIFPKKTEFISIKNNLLFVLPACFVKTFVIFAYIEMLEFFCYKKSNQDEIIDAIFKFYMYRTLTGTVETPIESSIKLSSVYCKNESFTFINSSYISTAIIYIAYVTLIMFLIKFDFYRKLFFFTKEITLEQQLNMVNTIPLTIISKPIETINLINKDTKYYFFIIIFQLIISIICYNYLSYLNINIIEKMIITINIRNLTNYILNIIFSFFVYKNNQINIKNEIKFCITIVSLHYIIFTLIKLI